MKKHVEFEPTIAPRWQKILAANAKRSKHTPGPWMVADDCVRVITMPTADDYQIAHCDAGAFSPDYEECAANATLIAAAPDLLAALEGLLPMWESGIKEPWIEAARAAIAKATG